jgi:kinesin family protein 23
VAESYRAAIDEDAQFAVFISCVEVYNNYIYDLLENPAVDIVTGRPKMMSKILREDSYRNMYVHGVTEVEVKSPEEALETFYKGQKQRKVAQTLLNLNSSRSHSVFNIRIAAVPYGPLGDEILAEAGVMTVSQLALVDLAGSERTGRTGNTGDRLAEASKINQSLMVLRSCMETLRENQQTGSTKMVPYRDSRITHLFRNYFEGEGKVKMIVCVNPRASDFDENINVMKFAELTQEVQIERAAPVTFDLGLTPGRRRGNQIFKEAIKRLETEGVSTNGLVGLDLMPIYNLGPGWPSLELAQCDDEETIDRLKSYLEKRIATRATLMDDHSNKMAAFRDLLKRQDEETILLRNENRQLKSQLDMEVKKSRQLEARLANAEAANRSLNEKMLAYDDMKLVLENELDEKELLLNAEQKERIKTRQKYKQRLQTEREKISSEAQRKLELQRLRAKEKTTKTIEKLQELNQLVNGDTVMDSNDENVENGAVVVGRVASNPDLSRYYERGRPSLKASSSDPRMSMTPGPRKSIGVANPRHRRSQSAGGETWLDHRPREGTAPLGTILQPVLSRRKSVTRLEERDLINARTSKYVLTTQNQMEGGDLETRLYKVTLFFYYVLVI